MLVKATAPHPVGLSGGRILAAGETGDVDPSDPHNDSLITTGQLTPVRGAVPSIPSKGASVTRVPTQKPPTEES